MNHNFSIDINLNDILKDYGDDISNYLDSPYYDLYEDELNTLASCKNNLKVLHYNIQGFPTKFDNFKILLNEFHNKGITFDILMLCEVWIHDFEKNRYEINNYKPAFNLRKNHERGGVAIYVRKGIEFVKRHELSIFQECVYESVVIELLTSKTLIGELYRLPKPIPTSF